MTKIIFKIEFFSEWHCSAGLSSGADVDTLVIKDRYGLPYIPGRTIKGLLREAAENLCELTKDSDWKNFIQTCFGKQTDKKSPDSEEGKVYFSNAELTKQVKETLIPLESENQEISSKVSMLYRKISSTAIGKNGQAKEHSLRKIEVVVPLTLFGEIVNCPDRKKMEQCLQWVKRLGSLRNQGLGRCQFTIEEGMA